MEAVGFLIAADRQSRWKLVLLAAHRCRFQVEMKMSEPLGTL